MPILFWGNENYRYFIEGLSTREDHCRWGTVGWNYEMLEKCSTVSVVPVNPTVRVKLH